jgi:5'(3')-deoxyribonucleotidase
MGISTVLLDMDEVLTDFTGGVLRLLGVDKGEFQRSRPLGIWDITRHLGISHDELLAIIYKEKDFWSNLAPLPWARELEEVLGEYNWYVATYPALDSNCASGKVRWLRRFFGVNFDRYVITPHKMLLANPSTLLIDDNQDNLASFVHHGGYALLFPSLGNLLHAYAHNPVTYVEESLNALAVQKRQRSF